MGFYPYYSEQRIARVGGSRVPVKCYDGEMMVIVSVVVFV